MMAKRCMSASGDMRRGSSRPRHFRDGRRSSELDWDWSRASGSNAAEVAFRSEACCRASPVSIGLLVGDAAGAVSPLTAGGLDPCLRLSEFAAQVIDAAIRTDDPSPLQAYSGAAFRRKFRTPAVAAFGARSIRSRRAVNAACWCLRTPIGRKLAARVFFHPASFPDTPRVRSTIEELSPAM